jgi:hypothetical protein
MSFSVSRLILLYASVVGLVTRTSEVFCIFSPSFKPLYSLAGLHKLQDVTLGQIGSVCIQLSGRICRLEKKINNNSVTKRFLKQVFAQETSTLCQCASVCPR